MRSTAAFLSPGIARTLVAALTLLVAGCAQPTASPIAPREVRAACDHIEKLAAPIRGVSVVRHDGTFNDDILGRDFSGCILDFSGTFSALTGNQDLASHLHETMAAEGWEEMIDHSADGPDGTVFMFRRGEIACLFRGEWDGGADDDPDLPPQDWYKVFAGCTQAP